MSKTLKTKIGKDKLATEKYVWAVSNSFEERIMERFDKFEGKMEKRFNLVITTLVSIAGQFKKFDEERIILSDHSKNHTDKIENLERKVFGAIQY